MNTNSSLFRELTREELCAVARAHFGTARLCGATLLEGGLFNTTYRLRLECPGAGERRAVLRAGPVNRHLLMDWEQNLMRAEEWVDGLLARQGLPIPRVLACDTSRKILDRDYMLTDFIDSVAMSDPSVPPADKPALYERLGQLERRIHAISGEQFGRASGMVNGRGFASWSGYLEAEIANIAAKLAQMGGLSEAETASLCGAVRQNRGLLDEVREPRLVHADLWEGNVLLRRGASGWEIAALIDGDRALFGDPDYEFASSWGGNADALRGYGMKDAAFHTPRRKRRRSLYRMHYHLIDAYVLFAEYNDRAGYEANRRDALALAAPLRSELEPNGQEELF